MFPEGYYLAKKVIITLISIIFLTIAAGIFIWQSVLLYNTSYEDLTQDSKTLSDFGNNSFKLQTKINAGVYVPLLFILTYYYFFFRHTLAAYTTDKLKQGKD